eukprot:30706-Pelagococcus_subviridis.AAC.13
MPRVLRMRPGHEPELHLLRGDHRAALRLDLLPPVHARDFRIVLRERSNLKQRARAFALDDAVELAPRDERDARRDRPLPVARRRRAKRERLLREVQRLLRVIVIRRGGLRAQLRNAVDVVLLVRDELLASLADREHVEVALVALVEEELAVFFRDDEVPPVDAPRGAHDRRDDVPGREHVPGVLLRELAQRRVLARGDAVVHQLRLLKLRGKFRREAIERFVEPTQRPVLRERLRLERRPLLAIDVLHLRETRELDLLEHRPVRADVHARGVRLLVPPPLLAVVRPRVPLLRFLRLHALLTRALARRALADVAADELGLVPPHEPAAAALEPTAPAEARPRRGLVVHEGKLGVVVVGEKVEHGAHALRGAVPRAAVLAVPGLVPVRGCEEEGRGRGGVGRSTRGGGRGQRDVSRPRSATRREGRRSTNPIDRSRVGGERERRREREGETRGAPRPSLSDRVNGAYVSALSGSADSVGGPHMSVSAHCGTVNTMPAVRCVRARGGRGRSAKGGVELVRLDEQITDRGPGCKQVHR